MPKVEATTWDVTGKHENGYGDVVGAYLPQLLLNFNSIKLGCPSLWVSSPSEKNSCFRSLLYIYFFHWLQWRETFPWYPTIANSQRTVSDTLRIKNWRKQHTYVGRILFFYLVQSFRLQTEINRGSMNTEQGWAYRDHITCCRVRRNNNRMKENALINRGLRSKDSLIGINE